MLEKLIELARRDSVLVKIESVFLLTLLFFLKIYLNIDYQNELEYKMIWNHKI